MTIYVFFPVGVFYYFNMPKFYEEYVHKRMVMYSNSLIDDSSIYLISVLPYRGHQEFQPYICLPLKNCNQLWGCARGMLYFCAPNMFIIRSLVVHQISIRVEGGRSYVHVNV